MVRSGQIASNILPVGIGHVKPYIKISSGQADLGQKNEVPLAPRTPYKSLKTSLEWLRILQDSRSQDRKPLLQVTLCYSLTRVTRVHCTTRNEIPARSDLVNLLQLKKISDQVELGPTTLKNFRVSSNCLKILSGQIRFGLVNPGQNGFWVI